MKKFIIVKLDCPCTLVKSAMRVPEAEPLNFAKALIDALPNETIDVVMLGHAQDQIEYDDNGTIRTVPYFGNPKTLKDEFTDDCKVIIWQGRHIFNVEMPSTPSQLGSQPHLVNPWCAGDYERLCMLKIWQIQMYNLLSSAVVPEDAKLFFLVTDLRLPLIELNKVDPIAVPKPLPKGIVLLTQAYHADAYNKWQAKYGTGLTYPEMNITDYMYEFKETMYLPLHALPLWSHRQFAKRIEDKTKPAIFQVQSLKYIDDYRKKKLGEALKFVDGNCTLHGRFLSAERGIVVAAYPDYADKLLENCIDNSNKASESFFDSARILAEHRASLIITDQRYARFGLCPNRFVEAIAVNTIPLHVKGVFDNCDDTLKSIVDELNICPEYTAFEFGKLVARCKTDPNSNMSLDWLEQKFSEACVKLSEQLLTALSEFANKYWE